MAKFGETDPRWIVKERKDGTNVHNWHWTEQDCTSWSKSRLQELFFGFLLNQSTDALTIKFTKLESFDGEAIVNNRKNKLIATFDLVLKLSWEGKSKDDMANGQIEIPNLSDEQDEDDWEVRVQTANDSKFSQKCKEVLLRQGRPKIRCLLKEFVDELKSGSSIEKSTEKDKQTYIAKKEQLVSKEIHTLELREEYSANAQDIYECFVNEERLKAFTQSPAKVDGKIGGEFSWLDGSITGKFLDMKPPSYLEFNWRFNTWPDEHYSRVRLNFNTSEPGLTVVKLKQERIPESDKFGNMNVLEVTENGWRERIMHRIRVIFGYGV